MKTTKSDLIRIVEQQLKLTNKRSTQVINTILGTITKALAEGEEISLRDFGRFFLRTQAARRYHLPKGGPAIERGPRRAVHFTAFGKLRARIDDFGIYDLENLCLPLPSDERRQKPRADLRTVGMAIVRISGIPVCEFKIKDISAGGSALLVEEDSVMLRNIQVGQEIDIRINQGASSTGAIMQRAKIVHITKTSAIEQQGCYTLGIQILGNLPM